MVKLNVSKLLSTWLAVFMSHTLLLHPTAASFELGFNIELPVWFELIPRLRHPILLPYRHLNAAATTRASKFPMIKPGPLEYIPPQQMPQTYPLQQTGRSVYPMFQQTSPSTQVYPVQSSIAPYMPVGYSAVNWQTPKPFLLQEQNVQYHETSTAKQEEVNRMKTPEIPPAPEEEEHQEDIQYHQESSEEN